MPVRQSGCYIAMHSRIGCVADVDFGRILTKTRSGGGRAQRDGSRRVFWYEPMGSGWKDVEFHRLVFEFACQFTHKLCSHSV